MAADSSISQIVFFIAAVVVAGSLAGVFIGISYSMGQTIQQRGDAIAQDLQTDITIINDPVRMPYANGSLTIYVKNTGEASISISSITVMVDGQVINETTFIPPAGSNGMLLPEKVLEFHIPIVLNSGDHFARAVTGNGMSDKLEFRI